MQRPIPRYDDDYTPTPRPAVRSVPMRDGKAVTTPKSISEVFAGIALLVFGALLWLAGARYTLTGWVYGLNWFFAWLGVPLRVPPIIGWWVLLAIPIGLTYSFVELRRPWRYTHKDWTRVVLFWVIWLVIVSTDGGSTFLGVKQPAADAWLVTRQVAASDVLSAVWSTVLTFVPEWFIMGAIMLLRR